MSDDRVVVLGVELRDGTKVGEVTLPIAQAATLRRGPVSDEWIRSVMR